MKTEQFNIRLPKGLLDDLNLISDILHVNKSEWIKTNLAKTVYEEKKRLLKDIKDISKNKMILSQFKKIGGLVQ